MNIPSARTIFLALAWLFSSTTQAADDPGLLLSRSDAAAIIQPNEIAVSRTATPEPSDRGSATIRRAAFVALGAAAVAGVTAALLYFVVFPRAAKAAGNAAANSGGPDNSNLLLNR